MKSIKARFEKQKNKTPDKGDYINLSSAIRGQRFSKRTIENFFNQVIDFADYCKSNKKELIHQLCDRSNLSEEGEK